MPYFVVSLKKDDTRKWWFVTAGENSTDAVVDAYSAWEADKFDEELEEAGSFNQLAEDLLAELFDCTEIHRHDVLEYVERKLDGDIHISIRL